MQFPYLNRTDDIPIARRDGTVYAYQWTSWRLTARGAVIYRVVRRYLCGHSHETFRSLPSQIALAQDDEHRDAMLIVLSREASAAPFDREHAVRVQCDRSCRTLRHHEPKALFGPPRLRRPRKMRQTAFTFAA